MYKCNRDSYSVNFDFYREIEISAVIYCPPREQPCRSRVVDVFVSINRARIFVYALHKFWCLNYLADLSESCKLDRCIVCTSFMGIAAVVCSILSVIFWIFSVTIVELNVVTVCFVRVMQSWNYVLYVECGISVVLFRIQSKLNLFCFEAYTYCSH